MSETNTKKEFKAPVIKEVGYIEITDPTVDIEDIIFFNGKRGVQVSQVEKENVKAYKLFVK